MPQLFCDTRRGPFDPNEAEWGAERIQELFDLGATNVDVGFHTDHTQGDFPQDRVTVTRSFAEQAGARMVAVRYEALGDDPSGESRRR